MATPLCESLVCVNALGNEVLDRRDPCWAETPSIVDAERRLAVAVLYHAFLDLRLPVRDATEADRGKKISVKVYDNKRLRNNAILFLTSGPDRAEWYASRRFWATIAGYCPDKIMTKARDICLAKNIRLLPLNNESASIPDSLPARKSAAVIKESITRDYASLVSLLKSGPKTTADMTRALGFTSMRTTQLIEKGKRQGEIACVAWATYALSRSLEGQN